MQGFSSYEAKVLFALVTLMFTSFMEVRVKRHGGEWCQRKFVGRVRAKLEPARGVVSISSARQDALHLATNLLKEHCRACNGCDLAKGPPP